MVPFNEKENEDVNSGENKDEDCNTEVTVAINS